VAEGEGRIPEEHLDRLLKEAGEAILVGGQAVAFWAAFYQVPINDWPQAFVTKDADFLGVREDAARFARILGGKVEYPKTVSILVGVVRARAPDGKPYEVDVLHRLTGLSAEEVRRHAKKIQDTKREATYLVLSPVDCLISRLENVRLIADKQNDVGAWHVRLAIRIVHAFVEELLDDDNEKEAIRVATDVLRAATHAMGLNAYRRYGIDVLEAVPLEKYTNKSFIGKQWKYATARLEKVRSLGKPQRMPRKDAIAPR
jgi:hypothetical protein